MNLFYVIKVVNKRNDIGFVSEAKDGYTISVDGVSSNVIQFANYAAAQAWLRDNHIEKSGTRAYIIDNQDVIEYMKKKGGATLMGKMWCIENSKGEKAFWSEKEQGYFFAKSVNGYCCWNTQVDAKKAIEVYEMPDAVAKPTE